MRALHAVMGLRVELALAGASYLGLLVLAHPAWAARRLDLPAVPWEARLFEAAVVTTLVGLAWLALLLWRRLFVVGRRGWSVTEGKAVSGTLITEFALVMPVLFLVMSMIVQIALIANATLIVRYSAFAAARAAIVNLDSYPISFRPSWEGVSMDEPRRAAHLVLASISPRSGGKPAVASQMERILQGQQGAVWQGRNYADRFGYAVAASRVTGLQDRLGGLGAHQDAHPRLIPASEHMIPPHSLAAGGTGFNVVILPASTISGALVPDSFDIPLPEIYIDIKYKFFKKKIPLQPPLPSSVTVPIPKAITDPIKKEIDSIIQPTLNIIASGNAGTLDAYDATGLNVDWFSPKEVEIQVEYDFLLTLPSLHFVPGLALPDAPFGKGKAFTLTHKVRLQSTGGRRANFSYVLTAIPKFRDALKKLGMESGWITYW